MVYKATITSNFNDDQNRHLGTSETIPEISNIKNMKNVLSFQNIFGV